MAKKKSGGQRRKQRAQTVNAEASSAKPETGENNRRRTTDEVDGKEPVDFEEAGESSNDEGEEVSAATVLFLVDIFFFSAHYLLPQPLNSRRR